MAPPIICFGKQSSHSDYERSKERSKEIEKRLQDDTKKLDREIKVLLLGSSPNLYEQKSHFFDCRGW
jgi:hypothetical protein